MATDFQKMIDAINEVTRKEVAYWERQVILGLLKPKEPQEIQPVLIYEKNHGEIEAD